MFVVLVFVLVDCYMLCLFVSSGGSDLFCLVFFVFCWLHVSILFEMLVTCFVVWSN